MSHMRSLAKAKVLELINDQFGTGPERSAAWPDGATAKLEEAMQGLDPRHRQIFLWELNTLMEKIREHDLDLPEDRCYGTPEVTDVPTR